MIHRYRYGGENIVIDVPSGSIHLVDDLAYRLLANDDYHLVTDEIRQDFSAEQIDQAIGELDELKESGLLHSVDQTKQIVDRFPKRSDIKAICLHVAHDCNLRCDYCFASSGDYQGSRELMSLETGQKALKFLCQHSGQRYQLEVDFFGGEPLMNWPVVKQLVAYGRQLEPIYHKKFRFTLTTNGLLLDDEIEDFLHREMSNVVLSIDGRKPTNDRVRKTLNDKSSYDIIVPKFQRFIKGRGDKQYYVRGTFTAHELAFSQDVEHLHQLGFKELSMEPVVAKPGEPYALTEEHLPRLLQEYERLAQTMLEAYNTDDEFRFFHFEIDLAGGPCAVKKAGGCGAGIEYLAITPSGELYPCHQFVGDEQFLLGDLDQGIIYPERRNRFNHLSVFDKPDCQNCWSKYYCSGGCHANAFNFNADLTVPYRLACELERKRVELAIYLAIKKMEVDRATQVS